MPDKPAILAPRPAPAAAFDNVPQDLLPHLEHYLEAARAPNTRSARRSDWQVFASWCEERHLVPLPASVSTVCYFLIDLAAGATREPRKPATLARYLSSVAVANAGAGHPLNIRDPRITDVLSGVRRNHGTRQRLAAPMTTPVLELVRPHVDARDWAILCWGQASACRRGELCALDLSDVTVDDRGVVFRLARGKTDQEGRGRLVGVPRIGGPLCPAAALEAWLAVRGVAAGALFLPLDRGRHPRPGRLGPHDIHRVVKRAIGAAGLPVADYSAHSLRSGYVTDARLAGRPWAEIMARTGHTRVETTMGYARYAPDPFAAPQD